MDNKEEIISFVKKRPKVKGAYGYGSGVFKQTGYEKKDKPQIDLILVVDNLKDWHLQNIKLNPRDYSFTGKLFFKNASSEKMKKVTGITYLSNIYEDGKVYKYGTIEENDLMHYLESWKSFYLPGRFQKPNLPIIEDKKLNNIIEENREKALMTALFTLDGNNNLIDLFAAICNLSYLGDTRMKFAENPRKVLNIVEGSYDKFKEIYGNKNDYFEIINDDDIIIDYEKLMKDIEKLPSGLLEYVGEDINKLDRNIICSKIISYFTWLNKKESSIQTVKGLYSNGFVRSIKYASKKVLKKIKK